MLKTLLLWRRTNNGCYVSLHVAGGNRYGMGKMVMLGALVTCTPYTRTLLQKSNLAFCHIELF